MHNSYGCSISSFKWFLKNVVSIAASRAGVCINGRFRTYDYTRVMKNFVESSELVLPAGVNISREQLWNDVDHFRSRYLIWSAFEFKLTFPRKLSSTKHQQLVMDFAKILVDRYGIAADVSMHKANRDGHHAHILVTAMQIPIQGLKKASTRALMPDNFMTLRREWADMCADALRSSEVAAAPLLPSFDESMQIADPSISKAIGSDGEQAESPVSENDQGEDPQAILASIMSLCNPTDNGGGIVKRIDENRELLERINKHADPAFLQRFGCIQGWIGFQDAFLLSLGNLLFMPYETLHAYSGGPIRFWTTEPYYFDLVDHWIDCSRKRNLYRFIYNRRIPDKLRAILLFFAWILPVKKHRDPQSILRSIMYLCTDTDGGRGIYKRIDEGRELFECIEEHNPELFNRCPYIVEMIGRQDAFLLSLKNILNLPDTLHPFQSFPRHWFRNCDTTKF